MSTSPLRRSREASQKPMLFTQISSPLITPPWLYHHHPQQYKLPITPILLNLPYYTTNLPPSPKLQNHPQISKKAIKNPKHEKISNPVPSTNYIPKQKSYTSYTNFPLPAKSFTRTIQIPKKEIISLLEQKPLIFNNEKTIGAVIHKLFAKSQCKVESSKSQRGGQKSY